MNRRLAVVLFAALTLSSGCFLKFWGKEKPPQEIEYDIYGTVTELSREGLKITTKRGPMEFVLVDSSLKGGDFGDDAYVHVYYKQIDGHNQVTRVFEKIK